MSRKLALLIASSTYEDIAYSALVTPKSDVDAMAKVLSSKKIGDFDDVKLLIDEPIEKVRLQIEQFFSGKNVDDLLVLYFSGHGDLNKRGSLYLIAKNTQQGLLMSTAIPSTFIKEAMDASRSRRQVLILDCCYSGAFARGSKGNLNSEHMATFFEGHGRFILTAANATQLAWEGEETADKKRLSVFTKYLVKGLETGEADFDGDGIITVDELYSYTYEQVSLHKPEQTPGKWTENQQGSIALAQSGMLTKAIANVVELVQDVTPFLVNVDKADTRAEVKTDEQVTSVGVAVGSITTDILDVLKEILYDIRKIPLHHKDREFLMLRGAWFDDEADVLILYIDLIHDHSIRPTFTAQQIREEFYDGQRYYGARKIKVVPYVAGIWVHSSKFDIKSEEYYKRLSWRGIPSLL